MGIRCPACDPVILQFCDEGGSTDFRMDLGSDQPFSAQVGRIGKPDTGVHVFSGAGGGAVGHFFGNHRDVVADENAGFPAGQGDDPGGGQFFAKEID